MKYSKRIKTVSLVLGSGGARGLAHIGVIDWLNENGYEIHSIAGTSIGALVGGIYAAGKLDVYRKWVTALEKIDVVRLLDVSFFSNSLFKGDRIINVLKDMIGEYEIKDLPISYTAVATNLLEEKEVWIKQGLLFDAIRASIAIPTIFSPHDYMGKRLLDGSLVNPIPIAPTLNDNTDITIAVNLNGKQQIEAITTVPELHNNGNSYHERIKKFVAGFQLKPDKQDLSEITLLEVMSKSMETMQNRIARLQMATYSPNFVVDIPVNACSFYEFYRANEMIDLGKRKAEEYLANISKR